MELLSRSQWNVPVTAYLACLGVSMLTAFTSVAIDGGFGATDLLPFLAWTLAFGVIISLIAQVLVYMIRKASAVLRYCFAGALGIIAGISWTYAVGQVLGPWFDAFSLPLLFCWIAGGAGGLISAVLYQERRNSAALFAVPIILISCLTVWTLSKTSGEPQLELLIIKWYPGPNPLTNTEGLGLSNSDVEHLKAIGITGELMYAGSGKYGKGRPTRAIIVTQAPLAEPVNLPQPAASEIIYVQRKSGWNRYPPDAPISQRQIRLWTDLRGSSQNTLFSIERADGSRQGGTAVTW